MVIIPYLDIVGEICQNIGYMFQLKYLNKIVLVKHELWDWKTG